MFGNRNSTVMHIADIRLLMLVKRSRHTNSNKVNIFNKSKIGSCRKHTTFYNGFKVFIDYIADIVVTGVNHIHFFFLYVKANGFVTCFGFFYRQRQANITKSDNAYYNFFTAYFIKQHLFHHKTITSQS